MVFRRKRFSRRPRSSMFRKRKSTFRRSKFGRLKRARISNNVHKFIRWATSPLTLNCTLATDNDFTEKYQLDAVQNYTEFTNLYDQYQIRGVQVQFQLVSNPDAISVLNTVGGNATSANFYPKIWYIRDYDNDSIETLAQLKQRSETRCKVLRPNSIIKVFLKPKPDIQFYNGVTATGYAPAGGFWLDTNSSAVPHYGLKYVVDLNGFASATGFRVQVEYKFYLRFKNPR